MAEIKIKSITNKYTYEKSDKIKISIATLYTYFKKELGVAYYAKKHFVETIQENCKVDAEVKHIILRDEHIIQINKEWQDLINYNIKMDGYVT